MKESRQRWYRWLYWSATVYDVMLGIVFLFFAGWAFDLLGIRDELPTGGYVPLIGAFLLVIGVAYLLIARGDLPQNVDLIAVGMLYKLAYGGVAAWVWLFDEVPHDAFVMVFGIADIMFFVAMFECWLTVRKLPVPAMPQSTPTPIPRVPAGVR